MDWHWIERCAARFGLVPWHVYRGLSSHERAAIIADYQESCLRDGVRMQREKRKTTKEAGGLDVESYL